MREDFIKKVVNAGVVDTKKYRYIYCSNEHAIKCILLSQLDKLDKNTKVVYLDKK